MTNYNWSLFIQTIRDKVAAFPNFIYVKRNGQCFNVRRNARSNCIIGDCLIGHGLVAIGLDQALWDYERLGSDNDITAIDKEFNLWIPSNVLEWARTLQREQDYGQSWSIALQIADNTVPGIV